MNHLITLVIIVAVVYAVFAALKPKKKKYRNFLKEEKELFTDNDKRLEKVKKAGFEKKSLMNKGEYYALLEIRQLIATHHQKWDVFTQVMLKAIVQKKNRYVKNVQNGLYCDFVVIDQFGKPVVVIEIDGAGHTGQRDVIKDAILQEAQIPIVRIDTQQEEQRMAYKDYVRKAVKADLAPFFTASDAQQINQKAS